MIASKPARSKGRIVCGTDFSGLASEAANAAAFMATQMKQPLLLVPVPPEDLQAKYPESTQNWHNALVHERLRAEAARLRALGATVDVRVFDGLANQNLPEFLRDGDAALVVLGATEHELLKRCLAGEAVDVLAEWPPISTLLVRAAAPFQQWIEGKRALRVLVASDPAKTSETALRCVRDLRRIGPCEVTIGYALDDSTDGNADAPTAQEIAALVGDEDVTLLVMHGAFEVYRGMLDLSEETQPDLLVVGSPQHHDFTPWPHLSVARTVLRHFPLNVVCAPAQIDPVRKWAPDPMSALTPPLFAPVP